MEETLRAVDYSLRTCRLEIEVAKNDLIRKNCEILECERVEGVPA